jgi:hypothetical protein
MKKEILVPDGRWVVCLNYRITMLNKKCMSIYALIVRITSLQMMCIKNLPWDVMSRRSIFSHIVRNRHLHVMCVGKFSNVPVP